MKRTPAKAAAPRKAKPLIEVLAPDPDPVTLGRMLKLSSMAQLKPAPVKTQRFGAHYELLIGIGDDHVASLVFEAEALAAFKRGEPVSYDIHEEDR